MSLFRSTLIIPTLYFNFIISLAPRAHAAGTMISLGSCLSSWSSTILLTELDKQKEKSPLGSQLAACVYYCRSDVLLDRLKKCHDLPDEAIVTKEYFWAKDWLKAIAAQYAGFGLYGLREDAPGFWGAYSNPDSVRVIVLDAYPDIRACLWHHPKHRTGLFLNPEWKSQLGPSYIEEKLNENSFTMGDYLPMSEVIENYSVIITAFLEHFKNAEIFLLLWPDENFRVKAFKAKERNKIFNDHFKSIEQEALTSRLHVIQAQSNSSDPTTDSDHLEYGAYERIADEINKIVFGAHIHATKI